MSDTIKSVFRQKTVEKIYVLEKSSHYFTEERTKLSIIGNKECVISDKVIGTYDVEIPMLGIGEQFFLDDIAEVVRITNRMRSTDGSITYYVEDKVVETERTQESYELCLNKIACFEEFEEYKRKYKYKHRFFNFL